MAEQSETLSNQPLRFSIPSRDARGRLVRLDDVLGEILAAHAYPPVIERTLAEALVLTALLGASLKEPGSQLTLQTQTEKGAIRLLACDYKDGALRGYAQFDAATAAALPQKATLSGVFGQGYLAITFDRMKPASEGGGRYQGIVPLEGETLADAAQSYFVQSEQIPTFIRVAVDNVDGRCVAGGQVSNSGCGCRAGLCTAHDDGPRRGDGCHGNGRPGGRSRRIGSLPHCARAGRRAVRRVLAGTPGHLPQGSGVTL